MIEQQFEVEMSLGPTHVLTAVVEMARHLPKKIILEDVTGTELSYRRLLVGVDVLTAQWRQRLGGQLAAGSRVGILLPNVNSMPVTVLSLWAAGYVPAILNFSTGIPVMLQCTELAGLKYIVTSTAFLAKAKLDLAPLIAAGVELILLEDVRETIGGATKFLTLLKHTFRCGAGQDRTAEPDEPAVILFTSGSEGVPKGVELTHRNLLANVRQITLHEDISDDERFFNALPLFHSFGLTACTLFPLVRGLYTFLYPSPLHYRVVPAAVYDRNCTVMVGTNTFLNGYARKAHPYDFRSVKFLVAGAEKVQAATAETWARRFGIRLLEGYGATECGPVIAANNRIQPQFGSVGRFLVGMEWRIEAIEGVAEGGRLFVRGPNVMRGYLNPEANAKFLALDGWYDTGDLARVDADGFLYLLGRLKRFAKVSGEMVSLTAVEDALAGAFPQYGIRCEIAVVAVPDVDKGEKLVAIANEPRLTLDEIRGAIKAKGLTNLCVPREVRAVREIPKLGTGKVNHRELLAQLTAAPAAPAAT
jgi:acyl-[acyl-carrier-protein]-phospholipid O-acyltransferase/long-chain-fatty-acid--[acyl-carrier-protein] ligase